jgi:chromosome segregation ATPase
MTPSGPETRVALTPEQRKRIAEQTGVGVEVVTLRDAPGRTWSRQMSGAQPRDIEAAAAQHAARSRLIAETRSRVEKIIRELEQLEVPELADTIAELRRDPSLGLSGTE